MMTRKDLLRQESQTFTYAWRNFLARKLKHESESDNYIYCFFEGDDDPKYYNSRIENITKKEVSYFICNKKKEVLKTLKAFELKEEQGLLAFFIDKDFDDFLGVSYNYENLYTTPCYAIENFYIDINVFKKILKIELKINEENELYDKYIKLYKDRQKEFHEILLEINSSLILYHYLKNEKNYKGNITYSDIEIDKTVVNISLDEVHKKNNSSLLKQIRKFMDSNIQEEEYKEFKLKLGQKPNCNFRGKFEIQFLNKFLNLLQNKLDTSFKTNEANIISSLSQYAETDENLEIFLNKLISDNS